MCPPATVAEIVRVAHQVQIRVLGGQQPVPKTVAIAVAGAILDRSTARMELLQVAAPALGLWRSEVAVEVVRVLKRGAARQTVIVRLIWSRSESICVARSF